MKMNVFKLLLLLWRNRKGFAYCRRTGKVPLCLCDEFLKNENCEHVKKLAGEFWKSLYPNRYP